MVALLENSISILSDSNSMLREERISIIESSKSKATKLKKVFIEPKNLLDIITRKHTNGSNPKGFPPPPRGSSSTVPNLS